MQVIVNSKDITKLINQSSYKIDSVDEYKKWEDGNFVTHSIKTRSRIKGSFTVVLGEVRGLTVAEFNELIAGATHNEATTMLVWVNNLGSAAAISCTVKTTGKKHRTLSDGSYLDTIEVSLEER